MGARVVASAGSGGAARTLANSNVHRTFAAERHGGAAYHRWRRGDLVLAYVKQVLVPEL
jgi:hypothetical protein